jgi:hypothetical protein
MAKKKSESTKPRSTSEVILAMTEETGLTKKQVKAVMDSFAAHDEEGPWETRCLRIQRHV